MAVDKKVDPRLAIKAVSSSGTNRGRVTIRDRRFGRKQGPENK